MEKISHFVKTKWEISSIFAASGFLRLPQNLKKNLPLVFDKGEIFPNFVAFSENLNFKQRIRLSSKEMSFRSHTVFP